MSGGNIPSQDNPEGTVNPGDASEQERIDTKSEGSAQPRLENS